MTTKELRNTEKTMKYLNFLVDLKSTIAEGRAFSGSDVMNRHKVYLSTMKVMKEKGMIVPTFKDGFKTAFEWNTKDPNLSMAAALWKENDRRQKQAQAKRRAKSERQKNKQMDLEDMIAEVKAEKKVSKPSSPKKTTKPTPVVKEATRGYEFSFMWGLISIKKS